MEVRLLLRFFAGCSGSASISDMAARAETAGAESPGLRLWVYLGAGCNFSGCGSGR